MTHDDPHRHAEDGGRRADLDADRGSAALHDLLSAWIDGRLDEAGVARLDELLRASPAARDTFREWVGLDALLATMAERAPSVGDDAGASAVQEQCPPRHTSSFRAERSGDPESIVKRRTLRWIPDRRRYRGLSGMTACLVEREMGSSTAA